MKIAVSAHDLRESLSACALVLGKSTTASDRPVVRLEATTDGLTVCASGGLGRVSAEVNAQAAGTPGAITVSHKDLSGAVKAIGDAVIDMEAKDKRLKITSTAADYLLLADEPLDFGEESEAWSAIASFQPEAFRSAVDRASAAAATESTRYAIDGVLLEVQGEDARLVATDGRRLHCVTLPTGAQHGAEFRAIVKAQTLKQAVRSLGTEAMVDVSLSDRHVALTNGTTTIALRLSDARFPDWRAVVPGSSELSVDLGCDDFANLVSRVCVMSPSDLRVIKLSWRQGKLHASAEQSGHGRADAEIPCPLDRDHELCANGDYLVAVTKAMDGDGFKLSMTDENSPMLFEAGDARCALMPISGT